MSNNWNTDTRGKSLPPNIIAHSNIRNEHSNLGVLINFSSEYFMFMKLKDQS
ncbi:predicted protein [Botrytis cinerea T4]|uniref:Uncharacterized protein n=1 Tax=Botryotinia fuckeliana (strain T4) TaxID=999810 RepID=G2XNC9_BOTF4|nr:predicted protein [Botrytis cinerea T4]